MKYIFTLLAIVLAVSAITVYFLQPAPDIMKEDILVTVNGHNLSRSLLEQKKSQSSYHSKDEKALLDTIIINELLIQEAQRQEIDKEPSFRLSIQDYYEQSLIKILIDRQFSDTKPEATDEEIDRYISNHGKIFTFSKLSASQEADTKQEEQQKSVLFDDLSDSLKLMLNDMKPGDEKIYFQTGNELLSLRLDKIEQGPVQEPYEENRKWIRRVINNYKREKALTSWIKELRDRATITTPRKIEKP
ncbi:MAG: hypothetical protein K9K37_08915 [Desulfocapsa sp.]|nr:hypothetical protein [Desulfocapsa sp.]